MWRKLLRYPCPKDILGQNIPPPLPPHRKTPTPHLQNALLLTYPCPSSTTCTPAAVGGVQDGAGLQGATQVVQISLTWCWKALCSALTTNQIWHCSMKGLSSKAFKQGRQHLHLLFPFSFLVYSIPVTLLPPSTWST